MRIVPLVLVLVALAPLAEAGRVVTRTYEAPAAQIGGFYLAAGQGDAYLVSDDGSIDVGGVLAVAAAPGETTVEIRVRDASGAPVKAAFCQDANGDGGCSVGGSDHVRFLCDGDLPREPFLVGKRLHVIVPAPGGTLSGCVGAQGATLRGTVTFDFG